MNQNRGNLKKSANPDGSGRFKSLMTGVTSQKDIDFVKFYTSRLVKEFFPRTNPAISYPDPPDAVLVISDGRTIAVEFRQLHWGKKGRRGDPWRRVASNLDRLESDYAEAVSRKSASRLAIDLRLARPALPPPNRWAQFVDELVDVCALSGELESEIELGSIELSSYSVLNRYVESISVLPRLVTFDTEHLLVGRRRLLNVVNFTETFGFLANRDVQDGLKQAIKDKAAKLDSYKASVKADEYWLALYGGGMAPSTWPADPAQLRAVSDRLSGLFASSGFSRIVYDRARDPLEILWP
jgi:hypothetical protein